MRIFPSTIERLMYILLAIVFAAVVFETYVAIHVISELDKQQQSINNGVQSIEKEQQCIAAFFLQPNRLNITLDKLKVCNDIVKSLPR